MSKRHDKIGIKQGLRKEWLDQTLNLKLSGLSNKEIRNELILYMSDKLDNGSIGIRGKQTTQMAVSMLSKIWINPDNELLNFRNRLLEIAAIDNYLQCHWAMLSAAYPFWYKVAQQAGRLLNLQEQISKNQIIQRIKEEYGDRSTVIRSAQRVIQGFLAFGVIEESEHKNYYSLSNPIDCNDEMTILLYEAALYTQKEGRTALGLLKNNPAFFPFQLSVLTGDFISQHSNTIDVVRYGLDDELLKLRN